jgi:hypothetical protein
MRVGKQVSWHSVGASLVMLTLAFAVQQPTRRAPRPRPTPGPTEFAAGQVDSAPLDSINAYAQRLHFVTTRPAAGIGPVDFAEDAVGKGPVARIEPETGSAVVDTRALAQGRIVARIRSDSVYAPAGFGPWWTYWWVDMKAGHWRSLFIRSDSAGKPRVQSGYVLGHPPLPKYAKTCPTTKWAACARFNAGYEGKDVTTCHQCWVSGQSVWCAGAVPTATKQ